MCWVFYLYLPMTVITLGNLDSFNFIVVDTQVSDAKAEFEKYQEIDNVNKLLYAHIDNYVITFAGFENLYKSLYSIKDISFPSIVRDRKYRDDIISFVNDYKRIHNTINHTPSKLVIMNKNDIFVWKINYDGYQYHLNIIEPDLTTIPANTLYMVCFGYEPNQSEIKIDINTLTTDNFDDIVFNKMREIHHKWAHGEQQDYLIDLKYYSSAYILKNNPAIPHTVIKYYNAS